MTRTFVFKLLTEADWDAAEAAGSAASALDVADGYVHLSTAAQVRETARRHFRGSGRVRLLRFDPDTLPPLRWEASRGGDLFPHLYGRLDISLAEGAWWLLPDTDGELQFPGVI